MALELSSQSYEPKWVSAKSRCEDMDNSELKKRYGESAKIECCNHTFLTRQAILQHFTSQKHKRNCLDPQTERCKKDFPTSSTPDEIMMNKSKELRELKANYSKKCDELTAALTELTDTQEKLKNMEEKVTVCSNKLKEIVNYMGGEMISRPETIGVEDDKQSKEPIKKPSKVAKTGAKSKRQQKAPPFRP